MPGKCLYVRRRGISPNRKLAAIRENAILGRVSWYKPSKAHERAYGPGNARKRHPASAHDCLKLVEIILI